MNLPPPLGLLAELTHRCPLRCPYCSNPLELEKASRELPTEIWKSAFAQAAALGVLQLHLSGGEPMVREDLPELVRSAERAGLYANLITSGVLMTRERLQALVDAGLQHVQISFQDEDAMEADIMAGLKGSRAKKRQAAALVREFGLSLTVNIVLTRRNVDRTAALIDFAVAAGADRLELAHTQYHGWALRNMAALLPTQQQFDLASKAVAEARQRHGSALPIDYVLPDVMLGRPKACMQGWGRQFIVISPSGAVLPCHQAASLPDMTFDNIARTALAEIWGASDAFNAFRGIAWMPEPCRSCASREIDWGGCRCQAFALTGDARVTDPACELSPAHGRLTALRDRTGRDQFEYRRFRHLGTV